MATKSSAKSSSEANARKPIHVTPDGKGGWRVEREGGKRALATGMTLKEVEAKAHQFAKNSKSELIMHKQDGTIGERASYGNDPNPPRDKN